MKPDAVWVAETRQTLLMQVKNSQPAPAKTQTAITRSFKIFVPVISFKWMRAPAGIAVAIVAALFSGSLFSVSAAEQALPGDFLYSIKLVTEQARIAMVKSPGERVKLKTEFTERRVTEMKQVIDSPLPDKSDRVKQAAEVLKRDMNTIKNQLEDVKNNSTPEDAKQTATLVDEKIAALIADLQASKINLSAAEKIKLSEAQVAASDTSLKAIEVLLKTHFENAEVVTEEELIAFLKNYNINVATTVSESTGMKVEVSTSTPSDTPVLLTIAKPTGASSTDATASSTTDGADALGTPEEKMQEAAKSFSEADKQADDKNLNEAIELSRVGTQQAFAVQKTFEEGEVKLEEEAAAGELAGDSQPNETENTQTTDTITEESNAVGTTSTESTPTEPPKTDPTSSN
jgi:hypothetical protein